MKLITWNEFTEIHLDIKRRHVVFCLKKLTPDMETIHMMTIYHLVKRKCPKAVIKIGFQLYSFHFEFNDLGCVLYYFFTCKRTLWISSIRSNTCHHRSSSTTHLNSKRFVSQKKNNSLNFHAFYHETFLLLIVFEFSFSFIFRIPKTVGLNNNNIRFDLSRDDLYCLNEGQFLNDNIIDFYLQ